MPSRVYAGVILAFFSSFLLHWLCVIYSVISQLRRKKGKGNALLLVGSLNTKQ